MKKKTYLSWTGLCAAMILQSVTGRAQSWSPVSGNLITNSTNMVGIGTTTPVEKLTINDGNIAMTRTAAPNDNGGTNFRYISAKTQRSILYIGTDPNSTTGEMNGCGIMMAATNNGWIPGRMTYYSRSSIGGSSGNIVSQEFNNWNATKNSYTPLLSLNDYNGKAMATVGNVNPSAWTMNGLLVQGDISANPESHTRTTIGAANDGDGLWGTGYIGFNLRRNNNTATGSSTWPFNGSGSYNGGSVIYGRLDGDIVFSMKGTTSGSSGTLTDVNILQNAKMRITNDGKLIIADQAVNIWGGANPSINYTSSSYKLFVEKGILTERVRVAVKNTTEWADYVFAPDYELMPLKDLETFIGKEKHLPGVPTTEQVIKEGVDLGQMQAKLLEKVEELTQYILMQQKEIDALKNVQKKQLK